MSRTVATGCVSLDSAYPPPADLQDSTHSSLAAPSFPTFLPSLRKVDSTPLASTLCCCPTVVTVVQPPLAPSTYDHDCSAPRRGQTPPTNLLCPRAFTSHDVDAPVSSACMPHHHLLSLGWAFPARTVLTIVVSAPRVWPCYHYLAALRTLNQSIEVPIGSK